jgi:hypothetical protein
MLDLATLRSQLDYSPGTGEFRWKVSNSPRVRVGDAAGWLDKTTGYVRIKVLGATYAAHRLAVMYVTGVMPREVDHISRVKHDNRIENLRACTSTENMRNRGKLRTNKSGVCGVYKHGQSGKWVAQIGEGGVCVHIGCFDSFESAVAARKNAERNYGYHGNHGKDLV